MKKILFITITAGVFCLTSCRQSNPEENDAAAKRAEFFESRSSAQNEKNVYYRFPSPEEVLQYINKQDLAFDETLLLPTDTREAYISSTAQSMALGIYITDLAYVTLFKKRNKAVDYLETIKILSDALYIAPPNEEEIRSRVRNNLSDMDSLLQISKESYNSMVNYLVQSGNEKTLAIISAGAYVEALYLVTHQIEAFHADDPLIKRTLEQKFAFDNLYKYFISNVDSTGEQASIHQNLQQLHAHFSKAVFVRENNTKMEKKNGTLVLSGGKTKLTISETDFKSLRTLLSETRMDFVNTN